MSIRPAPKNQIDETLKDLLKRVVQQNSSDLHLSANNYPILRIKGQLVPLHTLEGAADKLLCAAWVGPGAVATGGADCKLRTAAVQVAQ